MQAAACVRAMIRHTETPWHVRVRVRMLRLATWGGRYVHGGVCASACVCVLVGMAFGERRHTCCGGSAGVSSSKSSLPYPLAESSLVRSEYLLGGIYQLHTTQAEARGARKQTNTQSKSRRPNNPTAWTRQGRGADKQPRCKGKAAQHASDGSATGTTLRTQFQPSSGATDAERHAARRTAGRCTHSARPRGKWPEARAPLRALGAGPR